MKKIFLLFICICMPVMAIALPAKVVRIVDGDTFIADINIDGDITVKNVSVRLRNVDTPEIHGKCALEIQRAEAAKQRLSELIPVGSDVNIEKVQNDKYPQRIDANVYDGMNRDVGIILIEEKLGRSYSGGKRLSWCD